MPISDSNNYAYCQSETSAVQQLSDCRPVHTDDSPNSATVAEFGDYSRQCGQALYSYYSRVHLIIATLIISQRSIDSNILVYIGLPIHLPYFITLIEFFVC